MRLFLSGTEPVETGLGPGTQSVLHDYLNKWSFVAFYKTQFWKCPQGFPLAAGVSALCGLSGGWCGKSQRVWESGRSLGCVKLGKYLTSLALMSFLFTEGARCVTIREAFGRVLEGVRPGEGSRPMGVGFLLEHPPYR